MADDLRGATAVAGIGLTEFGDLPGRTEMEVMAEAVHNALRDAGLGKDQVDGLFVSSMGQRFHGLMAAEYLGVSPSFVDSTNIGGSSFVNCVQSAAVAIQTGVCQVALICYGSISRSARKARRANPKAPPAAPPDAGTPHESVFKPRNPVISYSLAAARHMHEFGNTRDQISHVAVAARAWAQKNPRAEMRGALTVEEVANARLVCDPFTVLDCCLISDAGAAIVMVAAERARDLAQKPVYLLGIGSAITHDQIAQMPDLTVTAAAQSGPRAYAMAGVGPADIDVAEFYDAFTINTILFLEDLGFCPKGEGGRFVGDGNIAPGGTLPVNTNGGGLSCVHPGMYGMFVTIEAIEQLRGTTGERQIEGARLALANGNGGRLSSQVTAIFGTESTL